MIDTTRLDLALANLRAKYAEDQPRDDHGRFSDGGGAGSGGSTGSFATRTVGSSGVHYDLRGFDDAGARTVHDTMESLARDYPELAGRITSVRTGSGNTNGLTRLIIGQGSEISISPNAPDPEFTTAHEFYHLIDRNDEQSANLFAEYRTQPDPSAAAQQVGRAVDAQYRKSLKFDDSQPRDDSGRWTDGGGSPTAVEQTRTKPDPLVAEKLDDIDARVAWAEKNFHSDAVYKTLSEDERYAVESYVSSGFEHLNSALRDQGGKETDTFGKPIDQYDRADIERIDSAIEKSTVPQDLTLFRGMSPDAPLKAGQTFTDPAYLSTSLSSLTAEGFAGLSDADEAAGETADTHLGYVVELGVPKGSSGLFITASLSASDGEQEVLLPRNTSFKIDSVDEASGTVKAHVVSA